jgi:hypothetical protein
MNHKKCQPHVRNQVQVGSFSILASSFYAPSEAFKNNPPVAALFLDDRWSERIGDAFPASASIKIYHWPDFGAVEVNELSGLVEWITKQLEEGKTVDVGCLGGHGRTGAILAATVVRLEGLSGADAVAAVRQRYCEEAVEGDKEVHMLSEYARSLGQEG